jgi:hypothetical protein
VTLKEEKFLKERMKLFEKEIATLTDQVERTRMQLNELSDLKNEIKGFKLFLGRLHPEFKNKFPEIMQKIYKKK